MRSTASPATGDRVCFVRETDADAWSEPSGHHEPGETLVETARRETCEEIGLSIDIEGIGFFQRVRIVPPDGRWSGPIHRVIAVFTASPSRESGSPQLDPREGEIADARWFVEHPEPLLYEELRRLDVPAAGDDT